MPKPTMICLIACVVGVTLLVASWIWKTQVGDRVVWSEKQAEALTASASRLHQMTYEHADTKKAQANPQLHSSSQRQVSDGELAMARDEYETRQKSLDSARNRALFWNRVLFGAGVLFVIGGGLGISA
jgi:hypothetical protein